jgi:hypothetical protein
MKIIKHLTFGALAVLAATLLFQTPITRADDHGQRGGNNERGDHDQQINNRFVILLAGIYQRVPLGHGPNGNLGLTTVDLSDGSYTKVKFYPVSGLPGDKDQDKSIGTFYTQDAPGMLCAYDLPGGSIAVTFTGIHDVITDYTESADGSWNLDGTFELDILEATGIYRQFEGGHIHMVDILKFRAGDGTQLEDCFCNIHPKLIAP